MKMVFTFKYGVQRGQGRIESQQWCESPEGNELSLYGAESRCLGLNARLRGTGGCVESEVQGRDVTLQSLQLPCKGRAGSTLQAPS